MDDRLYTARMVLVGMSPETRRTLNEKWPEWRDHISEIEVTSSRLVPARNLIEGDLATIQANTLAYLKHALAVELAKRVEPMMEIVEVPELWHLPSRTPDA